MESPENSASTVDKVLLHSPLHDRHVALGAKMADFGGWEMPIEYPGGGVLKEHAAVRERVGDLRRVSTSARASYGAQVPLHFVNSCLTNDLGRLAPGQAQYTLCCEDDGGVVDDLIAYLRSEDEVFLIPNAANTTEVVRRLAAGAPEGIEVENLHHTLAVIAVQGPRPAELLTRLGLPVGARLHELCDGRVAGPPGRRLPHRLHRRASASSCCRPGTTRAPLWDALLDAGADSRCRPCGLGARDTLRTEMGYPLHGNDLSPEITPVQARVGWAVGWNKPAFWGRDALLQEKADGAAPAAVGHRVDGPRHPAAAHAGAQRRRRRARRGHQRHLLADPAPGHRAGAARPHGAGRRRAAGRRPRAHVGRTGGQAAVRQDLDAVCQVPSPEPGCRPVDRWR